MFGMKRITIAQHERGLLFRNRSFVAVLEPGVRWIFDPLRRTEVQVYDLTVPEFEHPASTSSLEAAGGAIRRIFRSSRSTIGRSACRLQERSISRALLAPGKSQLYWRGPMEVRGRESRFLRRIRASSGTGQGARAREAAAGRAGGGRGDCGRGAGYRGRTAHRGWRVLKILSPVCTRSGSTSAR